jgi:hypothetical protein
VPPYLEHESRTLLDRNTAETTLKPATLILNESGLFFFLQTTVTTGNPPKQGHKLATIAHSKTECIFALAECLKLLKDVIIKFDHTSPTLTTVKDIRIQESTHKDNTTEDF